MLPMEKVPATDIVHVKYPALYKRIYRDVQALLDVVGKDTTEAYLLEIFLDAVRVKDSDSRAPAIATTNSVP
jgi:hypothetical protein